MHICKQFQLAIKVFCFCLFRNSLLVMKLSGLVGSASNPRTKIDESLFSVNVGRYA